MMADSLEVSRSGYYGWLKRNPGGEDPLAELKDAIMHIWLESRKRFGARKVHAKLLSDYSDRFAGTKLYTVQKCMRELGIEGKHPRAKKQTTTPDEDAKERPDLLRRDFTSPIPTYKLVGDITYLKTTRGFIYLATVIDLATRMVVGWSIKDNMRAELVVEALDMARMRGYVAVGAIFHSDRGSQYTSKLFSEYAHKCGIRLSVGRTGSSYDNAAAESFFGTLKNEWYYGEKLMDPETTKYRTIEFIESYYNRYRPHQTIDYRVPAEVMDEFFERFNLACSDNEQDIESA